MDMGIIDISRDLSPATAVWPGDQPVEWSWTTRLEEGSSVNLGSICLSTHAGTHVDAPLHVQNDGAPTDALPLTAFVGPVEVKEVDGASAIEPEHLSELRAERVLFKTASYPRADSEWPASITPLKSEAVSVLDQHGVVLVGTDAPSVDPLDSTDLPAHHALTNAGIVNLEGLSLSGVESGLYSLLALPLNIQGADAAPVRAVLAKPSMLSV